MLKILKLGDLEGQRNNAALQQIMETTCSTTNFYKYFTGASNKINYTDILFWKKDPNAFHHIVLYSTQMLQEALPLGPRATTQLTGLCYTTTGHAVCCDGGQQKVKSSVQKKISLYFIISRLKFKIFVISKLQRGLFEQSLLSAMVSVVKEYKTYVRC